MLHNSQVKIMRTLLTVLSLDMIRALTQPKLDMQPACSDSLDMILWITEKATAVALMAASISRIQTTRVYKNV
jgi:hypothetical protein